MPFPAGGFVASAGGTWGLTMAFPGKSRLVYGLSVAFTAWSAELHFDCSR